MNRWVKCLSVWLLMCGLSSGMAFAADGIEIRGSELGNWWCFGQTVKFDVKAGKVSSPVTVKVYDSGNKLVLTQTVAAEDFQKNGWSYRPTEPGFYEAEFIVDGKAIDESYNVKLWRQDPMDKKKYQAAGERNFAIARHSFAVTANPTPKTEDVSGHFGVSPHFSMFRNAFPLARKVGAKSIRVHALHWDSLEPKKGEINWKPVDEMMEVAHSLGFKDEDITFNVFGTPQWASSRPEATWVNICVREYATVIPKDMDDWRNFLRAVIKRYPNIRKYELWNEPHLVGFSCFWADSVENFVALLKAGYETVKECKPDATVWLGGIAMRYLPFYEELLKLGGGKYFDVLPLHGGWQKTAPFHELEKKYGVAEKPVVSSEWHAMLQKPFQNSYPSERLMARNMMLDFLHYVRGGAKEIDMFCVLNLAGSEMEGLPFHRENRLNITHVSGLFRQKPYIQARYAAVAWQHWITLIKGWITVGKGYLFNSNVQRAICLKSDAGDMVLFWNVSDAPAKIAKELAAVMGRQSTLLTPEGRKLPCSDSLVLEPEVYYIVLNPNLAATKTWKYPGEVLTKGDAPVALQNTIRGQFRQGRLFDDAMNVIEPASLRWQSVKHCETLSEKMKNGKVQARFAMGLSEDGLDLLVEAKDAVHIGATDKRVWNFDSVQFALDTVGKGFTSNTLELAAALMADGASLVYKNIQPDLGGDLPGEYTLEGDPIRYGKARFTRENGTTVYRIHINKSELNPFDWKTLNPRIAMLVNNNDGDGRACYYEWGSGIGTDKNPAKYGNMGPAVKNLKELAMQQPTNKSWNKDYELKVSPDKRVISFGKGANPCTGGATQGFVMTPGAFYRVKFQARGTAQIQCMVGGNGVPRNDILLRTALTDEWKTFELGFVAPATAKAGNVSIFAWQQPRDSFEIRDFSVTAD